MNYWAHHQIKSSQIRKTKLRDIYKDVIIRWAKNKPTSLLSCRKSAAKINRVLKLKKELDNKGKILSVSYKTVNNILKEFYGRPKKIRKVFFLSEENINQRFEFCKMILERKINFDEILFTDESELSMGSYTHDFNSIFWKLF